MKSAVMTLPGKEIVIQMARRRRGVDPVRPSSVKRRTA